MITLKQLAHAVALNRHGNFHRAAGAGNISQSAFSRSIRALEEDLGVLLFDRQGAAVTPTVFGEALLKRAENLFGETDELLREIQLLKGLGEGSLKVAAGVYAAEMSASRAVGDLIERHPKIRCRLQLTGWKQVPDLVLSRSVDLGIAETSTLDKEKKLRIVPLGDHQLVLFCRPDHPVVKREPLTKAVLDRYPVVTVRLPPRVAEVFPGRSWLDKETGELVPAIEVDDLTTARNIVERSDAFGVATPVQLEPWLRSRELQILPFSAPWLKLSYGFIYLDNRMLSPVATVYMALVKGMEKQLDTQNRTLIQKLL